jgi:antitoxin VapB
MKAVSSPVALVGGKRKRISRADKAAADAAGAERKTARLFTNGASQAVRLPKEFRMSGTEVRIWKEGNRVVMEPIEMRGESLADVIERFYADCPEGLNLERNQPPMQERDWTQGLPAAEPVAPYRAKRKRP